jgi:hypothetical protein
VRQVGVRVVDAGQEADLAAVVEALDAVVGALGQRGVQREAVAEQRRLGGRDAAAEVVERAVLVERQQRVEEVEAAGQEDGDEDRRVGRSGRFRLRGVEEVLRREQRRRVDRDARADAPLEHLTAREHVAARGLAGAVEVLAGGVGSGPRHRL